MRKLIATILCFLLLGNLIVMATNVSGDIVNDKSEANNLGTYYLPIVVNDEIQNPTISDKLLLMSDKEVVCEVKRVSDKFVFYIKPGSKDTEWIDRRLVKSIHYQNGEIEDLTKKEVKEKATKDWNEVTISKNSEDVVGMVKVGDIEVKHQATTRQHYFKPYTLESSAEILVRRNAAQKNADIALVLKVEHHRPYGDPPVVTIIAEAYINK
ncbi:MAG: hypothetical protein PHD06_02345 [Bacteroidales bacterium]|nr:hypothetical protein [Bacteroidales bacterium]MDY0198091.1 hypothetical protein [Tenuifilaceae bacterium]